MQGAPFTLRGRADWGGPCAAARAQGVGESGRRLCGRDLGGYTAHGRAVGDMRNRVR